MGTSMKMLELVTRRAFVPIFRWDPHVTKLTFFAGDGVPYVPGSLDVWADDGGPVVDLGEDAFGRLK